MHANAAVHRSDFNSCPTAVGLQGLPTDVTNPCTLYINMVYSFSPIWFAATNKSQLTHFCLSFFLIFPLVDSRLKAGLEATPLRYSKICMSRLQVSHGFCRTRMTLKQGASGKHSPFSIGKPSRRYSLAVPEIHCSLLWKHTYHTLSDRQEGTRSAQAWDRNFWSALDCLKMSAIKK